MSRNWKIVLGVALASVALACGSPSSNDQPINAAPESVGPSAPAKVPTPVKTKAGTIGNGTWEVGKDIKPGTYRSPGAADAAFPSCDWQVKQGKEYGDMGFSGEKADPQQVTLESGQTFKTSGCAVWAKR